MPTKRRPDLKRVLESINTVCTACGYNIPPNEIQRGSEGKVICPKCRAAFVPKQNV